MEIIRDLNEEGGLVEPFTHDDCIAMLNYCYKNSRHPDKTVDYRLVELGMFRSCENYLNFESGRSDGIDNDSSFPRNHDDHGYFRPQTQKCEGIRVRLLPWRPYSIPLVATYIFFF